VRGAVELSFELFDRELDVWRTIGLPEFFSNGGCWR